VSYTLAYILHPFKSIISFLFASVIPSDFHFLFMLGILPAQHWLMCLSKKGWTVDSILFVSIWECSMKAYVFLQQHLTLPFFPCHTNLTAYDYTHLYPYILRLSLLWPDWQLYSEWSVCAYNMWVKTSMQESAFITDLSARPLKRVKNEADL
jgi:hypothetical protein